MSSPAQHNSLLTNDGHDVQLRAEGLVSDASLAGHHAGEADQVTGNDEAPGGVPLDLLPIGMKLLV